MAAATFARILRKKSGETVNAAVNFEKAQAKTYAVSYGLSNFVDRLQLIRQ